MYKRGGLLSAINPKIPVYVTNGRGRDGYINVNNGGVFRIRAASARPRSSKIYWFIY